MIKIAYVVVNVYYEHLLMKIKYVQMITRHYAMLHNLIPTTNQIRYTYAMDLVMMLKSGFSTA